MVRPLLTDHVQYRWLNVIVSTIVSTAALSTGAIAPAFADYVPTENSSPRTTVSGGVRGGACSAASSTGLVALAPQTHIGQTTSTQPTVVWFNPERESYRTEFRIAEYQPDGRLAVIYSVEFDSTEKALPSGMTVFDLSDTDIHLAADKVYRWQVVLQCNRNRPSESLVTEADLRVLETPTDLSTALTATPDASERSRLYAEASFWYDALAEALNAPQADEHSLSVSLLEELAAIEETHASNHEILAGGSFSDLLRQVIGILQDIS